MAYIYPCDCHPDCPYPWKPCPECKPITEVDMDTKSARKVMKKFDLYRQYDVFQPWLEENGFTREDLPLTATTELGEDLILDAYEQDGELIWRTKALQPNDWLRVHCYHPDGSIEEYYER